jgi:TRAP transporter 4TM/12TM fusion protein
VQVGFATLVVVLALEITRRTVGLFLMLLVLVFIAYNLWGHLIDGALGHGYISFNHFLDINIYTTDGLFGVPVRVAATYAFLFVMFGTFLEKAGGGAFFFNISAALAGRTPGGPAKVAVVSSALFGTMSGSPTADVVTTGSITIPMMRRLGYRASLAGGVEVAASTGGSILPPVMGSAAFIMAELTGIDYAVIVFAAIIPAALYYLGIVVQVHLRSVGLGLRAMSAEEVPGALGDAARGVDLFHPARRAGRGAGAGLFADHGGGDRDAVGDRDLVAEALGAARAAGDLRGAVGDGGADAGRHRAPARRRGW